MTGEACSELNLNFFSTVDGDENDVAAAVDDDGVDGVVAECAEWG